MTLAYQEEAVGAGITVWLQGALTAHNRSSQLLTLRINVNGSWDYLDLRPDEIHTYSKYRTRISIAGEMVDPGQHYHVSVDSAEVMRHPVGFMDPNDITLYLRPLSKSRQHLYIANMTEHSVVIIFNINKGKTLEVIAKAKEVTRERVGNLPLWIGLTTLKTSELYLFHDGVLVTYEEFHDPILQQWHRALTSCFSGVRESAIQDGGNDPA